MPDHENQKETSQATPMRGMLAWVTYDWGTNAFATIVQTFVFAAYFAGEVAESETQGTTWWGITVGVAGLLVAFTGPFLGAMADQVGRRKPWIAGLTWLGVAAVALMWFIEPSPEYVLPALLLVASSVLALELAAILYNAMLPSLATREEIGRWSGWGWGAGYAGGLACLVVALLGFVWPEGAWLGLDTTREEHVRATFPMAAAWVFLFSLPLLLLTPDSPRADKSLRRAARDALVQLRDSFRAVRRYMHIVRFLVARLFFIEGLTTVFAFGGIYARGTFGMSTAEIVLFGIALNVAAGAGAVAFAWIDDWIGGKRTVIVALVGVIVPGTFLLLVESTLLFWVFALLLGIFVGPVQAGSRSYLARIAPAELYNQMFGLYAFSGRATAFVGPTLVGSLTYLAQSQRVGMSAVVVLLLAGLLVMLTVPRAEEVKHG